MDPKLVAINQAVDQMKAAGKSDPEIDAFVASQGVDVDEFVAIRQQLKAQQPQPGQGAPPGTTPPGTPPPAQPGQAMPPERQAFVDQEGGAANFIEQAGLGYGTEIMAGLGALGGYSPEGGWFSQAPSLPGGENWQQLQDLNQKLVEDYQKAHPVQAGVAQAAGAAVPAILTGGQSLAAMTGLGAVQGAIQATGTGSGGVSERLSRAPEGAGYGAVTGALGKPIGAAAGWLVDYGKNLLRQGVNSQVVSKIVERLGTMSPDAAQVEIQRLGGDPAMLADVHPGMQTATAATAAMDPTAAATIGRRLQERQEAAPHRLDQRLDRELGPARDPHVVETDEAAARKVWQPVYRDVAPQYVVDLDPTSQFVLSEIQRVGTQGPYGASLQRIRRMLNDESGNLRNRGDQAHGLREEIDNMIDTARSARENKLAAQIDQVRQRVDAAVKQGIPGMQEADDAYFRSHNRVRAYESGRDAFLDTKVSPGQQYANRQRMGPDEREFEQAGLRYELQRRMGAPQQTGQANRAERILGHPFTQQKLTQTIGQRQAEALTRGIDAEQTFNDTFRHAHPTQGSRTAPVAEVAEQMWGKPPPSGIGSDVLTIGAATATGGPAAGLGATAGVAKRRFTSGGGQALTDRDREIIRRTADRLTEGAGPSRDAFMQAAQREFDALPRWARRREVAERIAAGLIRGSAGPVQSATSSRVDPFIAKASDIINRGLQ